MAHPNYELSLPITSAAERRRSAARVGPFQPLPETREEGIEIGRILAVKPLLDDDAVKSMLVAAHGPRVLHVATHGFFLASAPLQKQSFEAPTPDLDAMRRSGLALAGANAWSTNDLAGVADGVLYAEDVALLDLNGTQLVVLSACDTGRGSVRSGEGVFGLRRAIVLAGGGTLVMSLWRVHDTRAKELMIKFYQFLSKPGMTYSKALRSAQLAMKADYPDPAVWGSFICQEL